MNVNSIPKTGIAGEGGKMEKMKRMKKKSFPIQGYECTGCGGQVLIIRKTAYAVSDNGKLYMFNPTTVEENNPHTVMCPWCRGMRRL